MTEYIYGTTPDGKRSPRPVLEVTCKYEGAVSVDEWNRQMYTIEVEVADGKVFVNGKEIDIEPVTVEKQEPNYNESLSMFGYMGSSGCPDSTYVTKAEDVNGRVYELINRPLDTSALTSDFIGEPGVYTVGFSGGFQHSVWDGEEWVGQWRALEFMVDYPFKHEEQDE